MKHYLFTRWNVDNLDEKWIEDRRRLFEQYCVPGVLSQTNKNFEWVLICDDRTSPKYKEVFNSYPATVVYFNFENYNWRTGRASNKTKMERAVDLDCIGGMVADFMRENLKGDEHYIITSRLDNDDSISIDHIDKIQKYTKHFWRGEPFWLNLVRGYKWCDHKVYPINAPANPFISFVESVNGLRTVYQESHGQAFNTEFPVRGIRKGFGTWLQVIHGKNLLNKIMRHRGETPEEEMAHLFHALKKGKV